MDKDSIQAFAHALARTATEVIKSLNEETGYLIIVAQKDVADGTKFHTALSTNMRGELACEFMRSATVTIQTQRRGDDN